MRSVRGGGSVYFLSDGGLAARMVVLVWCVHNRGPGGEKGTMVEQAGRHGERRPHVRGNFNSQRH